MAKEPAYPAGSSTAGVLRVLYVAQWFDPEPMIKGASFVRGLLARGIDVEVVTGFPNYPTGRVYPGHRVAWHKHDTAGGVRIHRVALYPSHDRSSLGRILNYFSFAFSAAWHGLFRARRFDVLYVYPPIPAALAVALICAVRHRPYVMDIQDLWPDSVLSSGMPGVKWMVRILTIMCDFAYRRAHAIVAQSQGIADRLVERGVPRSKISVIYNWADEAAAAPSGRCDLSAYGFEGKFNIVYGGNLGQLQGLDSLVRAAHLARERVPQLRLLLIGDGTEAQSMRSLAHEIGADNVRIMPGVPRDQIGDVFAAADVLALHLKKDPLFEITIPQKTQFYMAMGKPVLIGVEGEAGAIVTDSGAGLAIEPENVEALADAMVHLATISPEARAEMGARGRKAYMEGFSFASAIDATKKVLEAAARDGRAKTP